MRLMASHFPTSHPFTSFLRDLQHAMCLDVLESKLHEGATVLDVGCGSGLLAVYMAYMVGHLGAGSGHHA